jgi:hypothetical protein
MHRWVQHCLAVGERAVGARRGAKPSPKAGGAQVHELADHRGHQVPKALPPSWAEDRSGRRGGAW